MKEFKDVRILLFSNAQEARNFSGRTASIAGGPIEDGVYLLRATYDIDKVRAFAGTVKAKPEPKAKATEAKAKTPDKVKATKTIKALKKAS